MQRILIISAIATATVSLAITGCSSTTMVSRSLEESVRWPDKYQPSQTPFSIQNEIEIAASPQVVWDILVHAEDWPSWYEGAIGVTVKGSTDGRLKEDSVFAWNTMNLDFESVVTEFIPPHRLSWESELPSISGYHGWIIIPTETGCKVITDESQFGRLAQLQKVFIPNKLRKLHDVWLMKLKRKAEAI